MYTNVKYLLIIVSVFSLSASTIDLSIGSRGYGLGGAYGAVVNDPSAAYWNPAALYRIKKVSLMESNWIFQNVEGLNTNFVNITLPLNTIGTFGLSWLHTRSTLEEGWNFETNEPLQENKSFENAVTLSYGRSVIQNLSFIKNLSLGLNVNRYSFNTPVGKGTGLSFDIGTLLDFPIGMSIAYISKNIGGEYMGEKISPQHRIALGYSQLFNEMHRLTVTMDGIIKKDRDYKDKEELTPSETNLKGYSGLEYALKLNDFEMAFRGGGGGALYNSQKSYTYAFGTGFTYKNISFQYGFSGSSNKDTSLGFGHRVTFVLSFFENSNNRAVSKESNSSTSSQSQTLQDDDFEVSESE